MKTKRLISTVLMILVTCLVIAQEKRLAKADKNFEKYAYIDARKVYLEVAEKGYKSQSLYEKLGDSYYFNSDFEEAGKWYHELINNYENEMGAEYLFRYAQCLKSIERYNEADKVMEQFNAVVNSDDRGKVFMKTRDYMHFIDVQSGKFDISSMNINSKQSDYAPSFHKDAIVFASSRDGGTAKRIVHEWNEMPFLDLYTITPDGEDKEPEGLRGNINTKFHESSAAFNATGDTMYFTRNNYTKSVLKENKAGTALLKLYRAVASGDKWKKIEELPFNSDEYSVSHPSLSRDGRWLYFASDMPGTRGQSDIFVVEVLPNGNFGTPKNLGETINTEGRETFPFITSSGKLFFASDGHTGLGGLDVFVAEREEDTFLTPFNVGRPINSPEDDFTFIIDEDSKTGYFASNRKGGEGSDDIYKFVQTEPLITKCQQYISGIVTDKNSGEILANTIVTLVDENNQELEKIETTATGRYRFNIDCSKEYIVRASKINYGFTEAQVTSSEILEYDFDVPLALERDDLVNKEVGPGDDLFKVLKLEPIYFDLDKYYIRADAEVELQKIIAALRQYPELKIDVRSHTDSRSSRWYNKRLSERRAQSTIKYIIKKGGIAKDRITGRGYGEYELLNKCKDGVKCSEEEHQLNRRSEFIIMK